METNMPEQQYQAQSLLRFIVNHPNILTADIIKHLKQLDEQSNKVETEDDFRQLLANICSSLLEFPILQKAPIAPPPTDSSAWDIQEIRQQIKRILRESTPLGAESRDMIALLEMAGKHPQQVAKAILEYREKFDALREQAGKIRTHDDLAKINNDIDDFINSDTELRQLLQPSSTEKRVSRASFEYGLNTEDIEAMGGYLKNTIEKIGKQLDEHLSNEEQGSTDMSDKKSTE